MRNDGLEDAPLDIDAKAGSRVGCAAVLVPLTAYLFVMPDALHVWPTPLANPFLWLFGGIITWVALRLVIDNQLKSKSGVTRAFLCALLLFGAMASAVLIVRSV